MIETLMSLYRKHKEKINYLIFGVLTTLVNFIVYYPLVMLIDEEFLLFGEIPWYLIANVIAWVAAVIFAYVVNKKFVFESQKSGAREVAREFAAFVASRVFSFIIEEFLLWLSVDIAGIDEKIAKIVVAVITVILNYITGKLLVFRKSSVPGK